jgi:type II restriction/modification system DNA methylase subunit YeeA
MNKAALKNLATNARRELLKKVEAKAMKIGITKANIKEADIESSDAIFIDGRQLSKEEKIQRDKLITRIKQTSFSRVMEEVAYTWFNRFTALRFMEVNNHIPTKVRVLSSSNPDSTEPDMMKEALSLDIDIDKEYVYELKLNNNSEELFKYLIIKHCNDLNRSMPFMFKKIDDFTEILFPEGLLVKDSFLRYMTNTKEIQEKDWNQIEIIGWLYQFYIAEEKERVFKQKSKYKAEEIPFATQLFTPDWIVRYMVQNSLGRYWIESHTEHRDLLENWEFYLENPNSIVDFEEQLAPYINNELRVEDIKCFDPAMGSGHILVYMFDVLYEIYIKCGYMDREIPRFIIENNLYGLDIDDRAYQLACFSIVMKALEYNKRFLRSIEREGLTLHLASVQETNVLADEEIAYIAGENKGGFFNQVKAFLEQFQDAKTLGSLIKVSDFNISFLEKRLASLKSNPAQDLFEEEKRKVVIEVLPSLIKQFEIMNNQYDILITNPPYMGYSNMNSTLSNYVKKEYPDSKPDLFACFMEIDHYLKKNGFYASINQHSWMFLSSYEKLRSKIIKYKSLDTMLHLGPRAFEEISGEVVQSTAFVLRNTKLSNRNGIYVRLVKERTAKEKKEKALEAVKGTYLSHTYYFNQDKFSNIPGSLIAYWVSNEIVNSFNKLDPLRKYCDVKNGMSTTNNTKFTRLWFEISWEQIGLGFTDAKQAQESMKKWFPYNKGGEFRKWYGNIEVVVNWENDGEEIKRAAEGASGGRIVSQEYYFMRSISWSKVSSGKFALRMFPSGFLFDVAGPSIFTDFNKQLYIMGLMNSKINVKFLQDLYPTINYEMGQVGSFPIRIIEDKKEKVIDCVKECYQVSKTDWDSFETSWDFSKHPLLEHQTRTIESSFEKWKEFSAAQIRYLKAKEEELNRIFIESYELENELAYEVQNEDLSIREANLKRDIKSFISYAIGCSFGRYSLDEDGLIYAGGEFNTNQYQTFEADRDNILPILPGAYFEDDIASKFVDFVKVAYGEENLTENIDFIAETLGKKKGETAKETIRRYFLNDFYTDHVQTYKKRPIFWLFTSGKQKAFNCLIYMHRYDKTTLSRIRTDYLHEFQVRLDAEKRDLLTVIEGDSTAKEISNAKKELKTLEKKIEELKEYDELLHHMADMQIEIDLDDGVAVNYEKFNGLLAKI